MAPEISVEPEHGTSRFLPAQGVNTTPVTLRAGITVGPWSLPGQSRSELEVACLSLAWKPSCDCSKTGLPNFRSVPCRPGT